MKKALVTGGGGFVGRAIVSELINQGVNCEILGRGRYYDLKKSGIVCHQGDISDSSFVNKTLKGFDVVFHVAALAGIWGDWKDYYDVNVTGTTNIIEGCITNNVESIVYTSTPSVIFDRNDIRNGDETLEYPTSFLCNYAKTKAIAENTILGVDQEILKTCAIRPHLIWGPGDPHLLPRLIARGRSGSLKIIGSGNNMVDITYIDNVAHAHILAAKELMGDAKCSGRAYFIGQERPVRVWDWINQLFGRLGVPQVNQKISFGVAYNTGWFLELVYNLLSIKNEPKMTRFLAEQLSKSHYFSHAHAFRDFNYTPVISIEEGMDRVVNWLRINDKSIK